MIEAGAVHLACARVARVLQDAPPPQAWLSASEGVRFAAMRNPQRREQFLAGRWQLRQLLAQVMGGAPICLSLEAGADAPPRLEAHPDLHLALSHSGGWTACAVAARHVGIDLESPQRRRDIDGLIALCCTAGEQALFREATEPADGLFYELWTVKEAWLKRRHEGVSPARLQQLHARVQGHGDVRTWRAPQWQLALCAPHGADLRWWTPAPASSRTWQVQDAAAAGLIGA